MKVLGVGLLTLDVIHVVDQVPSPNQKVRARETTVTFGGPAANGVAVARGLGSEAALVAFADDSAQSVTAKAALEQRGVELVPLHPAAPVPVASVLVTAQSGDRAVVSGYGSLPRATEVPAQVPPTPDFDVLLVDGHCLGAAIALARKARQNGKPVILDGGSWKPGLEDLLALTDVAILSADFAAPSGFRVPCRFVAVSHGPQTLVLTEPERREIPVASVEVVDTLGAGDVLHGAFTHFLGTQTPTVKSVHAALRDASRVASESCRHRGALGFLDSPASKEWTRTLSKANPS